MSRVNTYPEKYRCDPASHLRSTGEDISCPFCYRKLIRFSRRANTWRCYNCRRDFTEPHVIQVTRTRRGSR